MGQGGSLSKCHRQILLGAKRLSEHTSGIMMEDSVPIAPVSHPEEVLGFKRLFQIREPLIADYSHIPTKRKLSGQRLAKPSAFWSGLASMSFFCPRSGMDQQSSRDPARAFRVRRSGPGVD